MTGELLFDGMLPEGLQGYILEIATTARPKPSAKMQSISQRRCHFSQRFQIGGEAEHSTTLYSTVQHSTAQHRTVRYSMVQNSTAHRSRRVQAREGAGNR